jgi:hypothetical protein
VSRELPFSTSATPEAVANLQYLKAFVKETFRVWPNGTEVNTYSSRKDICRGKSEHVHT